MRQSLAHHIGRPAPRADALRLASGDADDAIEPRSAGEVYRDMFDHATVGIFQTTADGRYLRCNPALARIYGYASPAELTGSVGDISRQLYVDDAARPRFVGLMREHDRVEGFEARVYRKDGSVIWIAETARAVRDAAGHLLYYEGFVADVTDRKRAEERVRESEERYALAVSGANDGLWDWDLRTGKLHFSARWYEMLGAAPAVGEPGPGEWFDRVHPDDADAVRAAVTAHREGASSHLWVEHRMRHADGTYRWVHCRGAAVRDAQGRAVRMAGSLSDVTSRKRAEEQLVRDALHDGLTGLPNRVLFADRLERSIARVARDAAHRYAVLFMDVDRFKVINDSLGHAAGDELLVAFAGRLGKCLRPGDTVARIGGDEFTVLLEDPRDPYNAAAVADRILEILRPPFALAAAGGSEVYVSASIGIATSEGKYALPQDVLRDADTALYRAKAAGRGRHQLFDAAMHDRAREALRLETDLRRAVDRGEFELHYQPIVELSSDRVRGFEALVRWRHPERGLVGPSDFIPVAEETGLIVPIGKWVLNAACKQAAAWHAAAAAATPPIDPPSVSVNLSAKQFGQNDVVEQVVAALRETGLPARSLTLEITESTVMEDPNAAAATLRRLKALGVRLHLDDFGTGHSSLAYLQRFPVDTMKIDRSFVARLTGTADGAEVVRTIVALAHTLDMRVTAEGIETADQLAQLRALHCENAQGYLLSRPLDAVAATAVVMGGQPAEPA